MTDQDFPHLFEFIQHNMSENTEVISSEVASELQTLIHSYEVHKKGDLATFLEKVQELEDENCKLREQNNILNSNVREGEIKHLNMKKSVFENKSALEKINEDYENKIMELQNRVKELETEKKYFEEQLGKKKTSDDDTEKNIKKNEESIRLLEEERDSIKATLNKEKENNDIIIKQLKEELNDKRKECDNLRMNLQKTNKEGMKLKKLNELLRATHKGNETVVKNLRREIKEEKENQKLFTESTEKRFKKDDELILTLVNNIKQKNFDTNKLDELLDQFNKRKMVFQDSASLHEEVKLNKSKLGNLEEYEKLFNSSMNSDDNDNDDGEHLDMDDIKINKSGNKDMILDEEDEISFIEDDMPNDTLKINETLNDNGLENIKDNSFMKKEKPETVEKDRSQKNEPVKPLTKYEIDFNTTRPFQTNKDKILDDLNIQLADRVKFMTNVRPSKFLTQVEDENKPEINLGLQETIRDLKTPKQYILYDSLINEKDFLKAVDFLEEFLKGEKNSTTFTMNGHEKRTLIKKFKDSQKKNLENFSKVFWELFIEHIYYLENTISGLTKDNSYREIKEQNMRSEMEYLIRQFLKKNEKNQTLLNQTNQEFMKLKNSNQKKLDKHELGRLRKQTQKFKEYVDESTSEKVKKQIEKPIVKHTTEVIKRKDRRYTRPVTKEDVMKLNTNNENDKKNEGNIWDKVTGWF